MNLNRIVSYINGTYGFNDVKALPQNTKKASRPAGFVNKYAGGDPNAIIWLYSKSKRYVGMLVRKDMLKHNEVLNWVNNRARSAKVDRTGEKYRLVMF